MKILLAGLVVVLALLQYRLWLSDEGMREVWHLGDAVESQRAENTVLAERNAQLKAEVADLKKGLTALEERARHDLGMITVTETFYQVVDTPHRAPDDGTAEPEKLQATAAATP
jgi:cell division protein FtsB